MRERAGLSRAPGRKCPRSGAGRCTADLVGAVQASPRFDHCLILSAQPLEAGLLCWGSILLTLERATLERASAGQRFFGERASTKKVEDQDDIKNFFFASINNTNDTTTQRQATGPLPHPLHRARARVAGVCTGRAEGDRLQGECGECRLIWTGTRPRARAVSATTSSDTPLGSLCLSVCLCVCVCVCHRLCVCVCISSFVLGTCVCVCVYLRAGWSPAHSSYFNTVSQFISSLSARWLATSPLNTASSQSHDKQTCYL
eukprot:COSAG03_NODE_2548_length_2656_cov_2.577630_4_plen_259_part_00